MRVKEAQLDATPSNVMSTGSPTYNSAFTYFFLFFYKCRKTQQPSALRWWKREVVEKRAFLTSYALSVTCGMRGFNINFNLKLCLFSCSLYVSLLRSRGCLSNSLGKCACSGASHS